MLRSVASSLAAAAAPARVHVHPPAAQALSAYRSFSTGSASRSHVGSAPIPLPSSVSFVPPSRASPSLAHTTVRVRGPRGELAIDIAPFVRVEATPVPEGTTSEPGRVVLRVAVDNSTVKHQRAVWGLTRSLLSNAVVGVSDGYTLPLRLVGVGYRATVEDAPATASPPVPAAQRLNLKLGFAHNVLIDLPSDVRASTPSPNAIVLAGIDKQRLGEVAARIRHWRKPEPYNGKGIFVGDEQIRRKEVKKK